MPRGRALAASPGNCPAIPDAQAARFLRMSFISELRYPSRWYTKLITTAFALVFFAAMAVGIISGSLLYRIVTPARTRPDINTEDFPGHPNIVKFTMPGVGSREGWFFPGLRTAPTILLCHGYQSNRGELLPLAAALQDHQYNVFLFDFAGHGSSPGYTTLGFREVEELRAAIATFAQRDDVDRTRFGLWGTNLGAYAVMAAAASEPRVAAFVVDSVYDQPTDMLRLQIKPSGPDALPYVARGVEIGFEWLNYRHRHDPPLSLHLERLAGIAKLYIQASDDALSNSTSELFLHSPEPRQHVVLSKGNYTAMLDEEKRSYEGRIVTFFLLHLPPSAAPGPAVKAPKARRRRR